MTLRSWRSIIVTAAALWFVVASLLAHPDYLAYFNEAVRDPAWMLAESDLDWGQDLQRLSLKLKSLDIDRLKIVWPPQVGAWKPCWREHESFYLNYFGSADPHQFDLPPYQILEGWSPVHGWIAISIHVQTIEAAALKQTYGMSKDMPGPLDWLNQYRPVAMAGKSIRIYHVE